MKLSRRSILAAVFGCAAAPVVAVLPESKSSLADAWQQVLDAEKFASFPGDLLVTDHKIYWMSPSGFYELSSLIKFDPICDPGPIG